MQPILWQPPIEQSRTEQTIMKRIKRAKLFVFLREHRHELFNEPFKQELATLYRGRREGSRPSLPHSWRWRRSCKPIQASRMTR